MPCKTSAASPTPTSSSHSPSGARVLDADDDSQFHIVLIGHAIDQLALIIFALQHALSQGLTRQSVSCELTQLHHINEHNQATLIWQWDHPTLRQHPATLACPTPSAQT